MESVGLLAQMGIKVALGVLLAVAAAALARRFHRLANSSSAAAGFLRVAETAALGQSRSVHLIRVGRRALLVGSTPSAISLLADVTADSGPLAGEPDPEPVAIAIPRQAFAAVLSRFLARPSIPSVDDRAERLRSAARVLRSNSAKSART